MKQVLQIIAVLAFAVGAIVLVVFDTDLRDALAIVAAGLAVLAAAELVAAT